MYVTMYDNALGQMILILIKGRKRSMLWLLYVRREKNADSDSLFVCQVLTFLQFTLSGGVELSSVAKNESITNNLRFVAVDRMINALQGLLMHPSQPK